MKRNSRLLFALIGCVLFAGVFSGIGTASDSFPNKPIKLYTGWGAGGGTTLMARVISQRAGEILEEPIIVIPKPGGGGTICNDFVRRAAPDGYTLTVATLANNGASLLMHKVPYTIDDFEYLGMHATLPMLLIVNSNSPWKTLEELVDYAKKNPDQLKFSSNGVGSSSHIAMEQALEALDIRAVHVPFKSGPEMLSAVLGGHVQMSMAFRITIMPVKDGDKIRFLASATKERLKGFPDVPTFTEKGYPSVVYTPWYGLAAPKGLPKEVSQKLSDALAVAAQDKAVHKMLKKIGVDPVYKTGPEFTEHVHSQFATLQKLIKKLGIGIYKK